MCDIIVDGVRQVPSSCLFAASCMLQTEASPVTVSSHLAMTSQSGSDYALNAECLTKTCATVSVYVGHCTAAVYDAGKCCECVCLHIRSGLPQPASHHEEATERDHQAQPGRLQQDVHHQQDEGPESLCQQETV